MGWRCLRLAYWGKVNHDIGGWQNASHAYILANVIS